MSFTTLFRIPFHCGGVEATFGGIQSDAIQPRGKQLNLSTTPGLIYFLLEVRHEGLPLTENSQSFIQLAVLYELND